MIRYWRDAFKLPSLPFIYVLLAGGHASRAVQFHPDGGQFDLVWLSARTPHGAYVW